MTRKILYAVMILGLGAAMDASAADRDSLSADRRQHILDSLAAIFNAPCSDAIEFESMTIDLGTIKEDGEPATAVFRWTNRWDRTVVTTTVSTTCSCVKAEYARKGTAPGEMAEIAVTYHQKGHPGKIDRKIMVYTTAVEGKPSAVLSLTGTVEPARLPVWEYPKAVGSLRLKYSEVRIAGNVLQKERIMFLNAGESPLTPSFPLAPSWIEIKSDPETVAPGETGSIVIGFDPKNAPENLPDSISVLIDGIPEAIAPSQRAVRIVFR